MINAINQSVKLAIKQDATHRFWFWQASFWLFLSTVSFLTLTLWYSQVTLANVVHTILQAILGLFFSVILYRIFDQIWDKSVIYRLSVGMFMVFIFAFIWTIFRMQALAWLTPADQVWGEFGGWFFASIFIFLCWTGLFHGIRYYELLQSEHEIMLGAEAATRKEHIKRIEAQSVARDAKLKMLRYQLNPHFLCNTLNAINSLIEIEESTKAQAMTVQLSQFLRHSLDNDPDTKITLKDEIAALNLYLEIEKTRFADRLQLDFYVDEHAQKALVPSLLLQPIIENSMKHAISKNEKGGTIELRAGINQGRLIIEISDTGASNVQGKPLDLKKETGVGLANTEQRLSVLYDNDYQINTMRRAEGGRSTCINMPFELSD
ncbi:sensor histidine kinase [Glaciecola sp. 33A]|jgi:two-component system LytT family sensor kinase|uniref:sensor histidine kinase n=1 Tax=Glaciecola sp. 33A TaxID=2057807 RepID=UPI000C346137|nr:histidine kinase [Glaciecola sp. 33A]PKI03609.1 sensor histidine kinase [Glaciecola sp. 33A]